MEWYSNGFVGSVQSNMQWHLMSNREHNHAEEWKIVETTEDDNDNDIKPYDDERGRARRSSHYEMHDTHSKKRITTTTTTIQLKIIQVDNDMWNRKCSQRIIIILISCVLCSLILLLLLLIVRVALTRPFLSLFAKIQFDIANRLFWNWRNKNLFSSLLPLLLLLLLIFIVYVCALCKCFCFFFRSSLTLSWHTFWLNASDCLLEIL